MNYSKLMNRNFKVKAGRTLVGFSGLCKIVGVLRAENLVSRALRSTKQVFVVKLPSLHFKIYFYAY